VYCVILLCQCSQNTLPTYPREPGACPRRPHTGCCVLCPNAFEKNLRAPRDFYAILRLIFAILKKLIREVRLPGIHCGSPWDLLGMCGSCYRHQTYPDL
jgi:hypothetical protein